MAMAAKGFEPLGADPYMRRVLLMCDTLKVESHTFARRMSHVTCHTSHVTRHTSHVTRRTSHVTRHTSHVQRTELVEAKITLLNVSSESGRGDV